MNKNTGPIMQAFGRSSFIVHRSSCVTRHDYAERPIGHTNGKRVTCGDLSGRTDHRAVGLGDDRVAAG
jgi:hypothetical protein